jgi:serum/glucocorticoid-regulated kinase 2
MLSVIGRGGYSKVILVRKKDNNRVYAMKVMKKKLIEEKKQFDHIYTERKVLVKPI